MAAPAAPGVLTEVLIGEIIHRFPPDNPACLFRASAVCPAWRAFVTNDDVIRRYREFHQAPPVLGLLQNCRPADEAGAPEQVEPRLFGTATPPPPINLPNIQGDHQLVLDCRHGRVLVHTIDPLGLIVCNPITGEQQVLPDYPPLPSTSLAVATGEDGGLGVAAVEDYRLRLWSWNEGVWAPWRDINLETMIPFTIGGPNTEFKVIGFAEMSGVIFVMANDDIVSTIELKSGKIREVLRKTLNSSTTFPFESFYTPGMVGA